MQQPFQDLAWYTQQGDRLIALVSSSSVKSSERFESAPGAMESWLTSCDVLRWRLLKWDIWKGLLIYL